MFQIQKQVNFRRIYTSVFKLFQVQWKYDPNLSVVKMFAYYQNNKKFIQTIKYIEAMQKAHKILLFQYIFAGNTFRNMNIDPLKS